MGVRSLQDLIGGGGGVTAAVVALLKAESVPLTERVYDAQH